MNIFLTLFLLGCFRTILGSVIQRIPAVNSYDPGTCDNRNHGKEVLVKDRSDEEIILICVKDEGFYHWKTLDGSKDTVGEFFKPGLSCSDILNKLENSKDGYYWISLGRSSPIKVFCDMTTDGGGFMLIGRKNNSVTWTVPSSNTTVEPFGEPHWSSSLGDAPILEFRVQMATEEDFKSTKAHWSYRLQSKRPLKELMTNSSGCNKRSAGFGDIAYVKDLLTDNIVTTKLRCSKFGSGYSHLARFGWYKMNSCLQKPCPWGFAFLDFVKHQIDSSGGFSFSTTGSISGMEYNATAFLGCDNGLCCGCYGPVGGKKEYCAEGCQAINGGTVTKNVFTWFWVRSSLPKRIWKKCMDYEVTTTDGKNISYKLVGQSAIPVEGRCSRDSTLLHDGIVVVPDSSSAEKVPAVEGLLQYRKDKQELYIRSNKTWNVVAEENKILLETNEKSNSNLAEIQKIKQNILQETNEKSKLTLAKIQELMNSAYNRSQIVNQKINQLEKLINSKVLGQRNECFSYKWLRESNRNKKQKYLGRASCDNGLSGWYRFGGGAGIKMATSCLPYYSCGTHAPGWMTGALPTIAEGKVTRKVCYKHGTCCGWTNNIEVLNCGNYYVYKLRRPPVCNLRYCGSDA